MKKILESIRSGAESIKLPEFVNRNQVGETELTTEAVTDFDWWADDLYPKYYQLGASVFNVLNGKSYSVPSLSFDAETVDVSADISTTTLEINLAKLPPQRIGASIKIQSELIGSMTDMQLMSFVKSGIHALNEEIFKNLIIEALDKGVKTTNTLSADGFIGLQNEVDADGTFFGGSKALTSCKKITVNGGYLLSGSVHEFSRTFDGIRALGTNKIQDETIIGFGDFKHSAVILYDQVQIIRDNKTEAKNGKVVFTFSQLANTGIITPNKFAISQVSIPVITRQPKGITKGAGETIILSVQSYGATSYQWKKDGININDVVDHISGTDTNKLIISNSLIADTADYTVELTNISGTELSTAASVVVL
tara:strand:+ start:22897 stop:23994 length:1098 start_codon:yes stop_codon:yes gene_type:complete